MVAAYLETSWQEKEGDRGEVSEISPQLLRKKNVKYILEATIFNIVPLLY